LINLPKGSIHF